MLRDPTSGRAVEEWVGKTPDTPVPLRVKIRVFNAYKGRCYLSGRLITPSDKWETEHVRALGLGGENRENNLAPVLADRHKEKTAQDVASMAKADRQRAHHLGLKPKSRFRIPSRPFPKSRRETTDV